MKRIAGQVARSLWNLTGPARRPISRRFSALIRSATDASIREACHPPLGELLVGVATARREVGTYRNETNLLLDSLLGEVTRLQDEVAALRAQLAEAGPPATIPIVEGVAPSPAEDARRQIRNCG